MFSGESFVARVIWECAAGIGAVCFSLTRPYCNVKEFQSG